MPIVRMPNGDKVRFPDNMPADEIKHLILKKFPDVHKDTTTDHLVHGARTFARAGSLGLSDKASKYGAMLINEIANVGDQDKVREVNNIIRKNTFKQRDEDEAWGRRNPAKAFTSSALGSILSPGASLGGKFVSKGAGLTAKALRSASVGGVTSGIYSAAQSDADNLADIAAAGLNGAGVGAAIGGAFPIATAGISKGAKAGLRVLRGAAARGKKIIENTPLKPLLTRTQDQLDDGVASLSKGSGERELLGSAIRDGLDDELTAVNRYQKGLYDKAYAGIDKKADIKTANTEAIIKELRDEVTEDGRAYLNKILKNLRVEKRVKDLDDIKYKIADRVTDNIDDVTQYLKNAPAEKIKSIKQNDLASYKKLLDEVINKEKIFNPNFKVNDPMHLIKDSARAKYLHTMHDTLNFPNVSTAHSVDGKLKEYLIKKYNNELGKDIYDTIIKKDDVLITKFPKIENGRGDVVKNITKRIQRDFGGLKPSNPAEITANPTALRGLQHDATGGFNSRVFMGDKANLATPSGDSILPKLQDTVKDKVNYKLSGYMTDNFDDVANYLKNRTPEQIQRLRNVNNDELKTLAQKLADDEIKKGTIKGIRDASKMVAQNRGVYVHTLPNTLSKTDVATEQAVKGQVKEYLIKKYGNEIGETIYDTIIKKDGILDTKFVNNKGHDEFVKWLKNAINRDHQSTVNEGSIVRRPTGNTVNLTTPSMRLRSVSDNAQTVNNKILHSLNANKRVMAYPNITQLQSLKSEIGGDIARGKNMLNSSQIGRIYAGIKKDIDANIPSSAVSALKKADRFYKLQQDKRSITKTLSDILGAKSDTLRSSKVLNALNEKTGNFKIIKALNRALNVDQIKDEGRALIRTTRDFNKLSRDGKQFLYGSRLKDAENLFNGALSDRIFNTINKALKTAENRVDKIHLNDNTRTKMLMGLLSAVR